MRMNKTNFKQYDTRWAKLGYPKKPYYIKGCGCGEVAIANVIIEMDKYKSQTPKTIQPYCKQFAAPNGNGTYFSGIPTMMKHYGLTEVKEHSTMNQLWKELAKGNRVAIYLMGNRKGGSKGVKWSGSAHFVSSVGYRYDSKTKKHMVYVKDSNSTSSSRNYWISYEDNMRGDVSRVWSGKLNGTLYQEPLKAFTYKPSTPYTGTVPSATVKKGDTGAKVKAVQTFLNWCSNAGLAVDGDCGNNTDTAIRRWQMQYKSEGIAVDGVFGAKSIKVAKEIVLKYAPTLADKILAACKTQAEWMKNSKYAWESNPTIAKSKKKGTCVTYVACVLQRIGYLSSGKYVWHDGGKVYGNNDKMTVTYPGSKKLHQLKSQLKAGDIVIDGNKNNNGSGSHIFILTGQWSGDNPIVWDNHSAQDKGGKSYTYTRNRSVIAVIRLK